MVCISRCVMLFIAGIRMVRHELRWLHNCLRSLSPYYLHLARHLLVLTALIFPLPYPPYS